MTEQEITALIQQGRATMQLPDTYYDEDSDYRTDQQLKRPQPPLFKAPMSEDRTALPKDFRTLPLKADLLAVLYGRKSSRVYTTEPLTMLELSFLLWATQGVKAIRGSNYATLRTVACGGARHEFECYPVVLNVAGLTPGVYHYMPDCHALERLAPVEDLPEKVSEALCGQSWGAKAAVVMFYSCIPYRAEWRYGIWAHRTALIDAGHITQNLYVAASGLADVGTCAIAAVDIPKADALLGLDGQEEFAFYAAPVGRISPADQAEEDAFYAFLREDPSQG